MRLTKVGRKTIAAWKQHPRYISSCGGTRSGKTFSILQTFIIALVEEVNNNRPATINSVVSESMPHLQRGAIRDFKQIMDTEGLWEESRWNETQHTYTWANGSVLEFFSVDNAGKVHGSARDRLFINECQNIPYEIARQLFVRTRGQIICDYNPTHSFWLNEIVEARPNCITIHSTYKDNEFLTPEQVAEIEDNRSDRNWWQVYGEGKVGTLEGLIYEFTLCDSLPEKTEMDHLVEIQGMDFGFTNDPTARVQVVADHRKKILWVRERCYRTHMQNRHIIEDLQDDGVSNRTEIYADCAEPKSIADICDAGFNVIPCDKDAPTRSDKLKFQLQWMQGWQLNVTKDSIDLIKELRNYVWAKDRDGNTLNEPIDKFNHCFTGDTLIETGHGLKRIDSIKVGDNVWTSGGLKKVERVWENGRKKVWDITLFFTNFIVRMSVTPDHRIKVGNKWKKVSELKPGDILWVSKSLMERNIISTPERDTIQEAVNDCTGWCGNSTTEQSHPDTKSTTRTGILRTMTSAILNAFRCLNTRIDTGRRSPSGCLPKSQESTLQKSAQRHRNGIGLLKAEPGITSTQWERKRETRNAPVNVAESSSCPHFRMRDSAQIIARQSGEETNTLMRKQESALYAERNSGQIDSLTQCAAVAVVLQDIEISEERTEEVFDLQVAECHEYFANGILAHNCLDAMRYAVWTRFGQKAGYGQYSLSFTKRRWT